ncbi:MAG: hypothetical protein WCG83_02240 [Candidatus Peregrinibacteria bacterium]
MSFEQTPAADVPKDIDKHLDALRSSVENKLGSAQRSSNIPKQQIILTAAPNAVPPKISQLDRTIAAIQREPALENRVKALAYCVDSAYQMRGDSLNVQQLSHVHDKLKDLEKLMFETIPKLKSEVDRAVAKPDAKQREAALTTQSRLVQNLRQLLMRHRGLVKADGSATVFDRDTLLQKLGQVEARITVEWNKVQAILQKEKQNSAKRRQEPKAPAVQPEPMPQEDEREPPIINTGNRPTNIEKMFPGTDPKEFNRYYPDFHNAMEKIFAGVSQRSAKNLHGNDRISLTKAEYDALLFLMRSELGKDVPGGEPELSVEFLRGGSPVVSVNVGGKISVPYMAKPGEQVVCDTTNTYQAQKGRDHVYSINGFIQFLPKQSPDAQRLKIVVEGQ